MKPDFDLRQLKGRKLFVGTPMYDGKCFSDYMFSIVRLTALCTQIGIELRYFFRTHEALIAKARNETVEQFLLSGCDSLIFIDADIGFDARDVLQLFAMQMLGDAEAAHDILAAPYPLKEIDWDRVRRAAQGGLADGDPARLARYASPIRVDLAHGGELTLDEPSEVTQAGTGFLMIRRAVFDQLRKRHPELGYRRPGSDAAAPPFAFFDTAIEDGLHVSEDFVFCRRVRKAGMRVWLCPWVELTHSGHHRFESRLTDLGAIGPI